MTLPCPICHAEGQLQTGADRVAAHNGVTITVVKPPIIVCPAGHTKAPIDLLLTFRAAINARVAKARRNWRGQSRCVACHRQLSMPWRWTQIPVTIETPSVFTLTIEIAATRCPNCGLDQLPQPVATDLETALVRLFQPETP